MTDIQRGDQVYYRGEVWTVWHAFRRSGGYRLLTLQRQGKWGGYAAATVGEQYVQRVEQVR